MTILAVFFEHCLFHRLFPLDFAEFIASGTGGESTEQIHKNHKIRRAQFKSMKFSHKKHH